MKKINTLVLIIIGSLCSYGYTLHPDSECEQVKGDLRTIIHDIEGQIDYLYSDLSFATNSYVNINNAAYDFRQKSRYSAYSDEVKEAYHYCAYSSDLQQGLQQIGYTINGLEITLGSEQVALSDASNLVNSIDCSECPVSSTNCCDFTSIISAINDLQSVVESNGREIAQILQVVNRWLPQIEWYIETINNNVQSGFGGVTNSIYSVNSCVTNLLFEIDNTLDGGFLGVTNLLNRLVSLQTGSNLGLTRGFGNVTNLLYSISSSMDFSTNILNLLVIPDYASDWQNVYPQVGTSLSYPSYLGGSFSRFYSGLPYFNNEEWNYSAIIYGAVPTIMLGMYELIGSSYAQNSWTQYQHDYMYPPITNSLIQIHIDSTNFFSFYRDEIGVQGVLASWTPDRGTYFDYLTNHYLSVVMGDRLSAEFSSKTNWFSRIESLLAALVFADAESTNTVSTSSYQREQSQIQDSLDRIIFSSDNAYSSLRSNSNDILDLYRSYVALYDEATMPSRVVLFSLSNQSQTADVVSIAMDDNPSLTALVESCRAITTFCWASVGIFCLFRFLFWAAKGIYYACRFVFSVISSIFK